jgi:predicted DNA-binding transcriptional regulator YafY
MQDPEKWVISLEYVDSKGVVTKRLVSPIRFLSSRRFLALCLCREEPRQFYLERCQNVELTPADQVMMPVAMA